jgi:hypothetical protein
MTMDERIVRPTVDQEVDAEFDFHVEMRVKELMAKGMPEEEAREEALRRFGDIDRVKASCRNLGEGRNVVMNRRQWWDELRQDLIFAVRQLRRAPSFAGVAVVTLALAIGANTAVFSVVDAVLLRPAPYPAPEQLAMVWSRYLPPSGFDIDKFVLSGPELLDLQETTEAFEAVGALQRGSRALTGDGTDAERVSVTFVQDDLLRLLKVAPRLGRIFTPEEDLPSGPDVTVLSHELWVGRYGADPNIVGRTILMNGVPTEVVGVMPEGRSFPSGTMAYMPLGLDRSNEGGRAAHSYSALARLAPGKTLDDAHAELEVIKERWAAEHEHNVAHYLWTQSLRDEMVADAPRLRQRHQPSVGAQRA